jgi:hypothetical protein
MSHQWRLFFLDIFDLQLVAEEDEELAGRGQNGLKGVLQTKVF